MTTPDPTYRSLRRDGSTFSLATDQGRLEITFRTSRIARVRLVHDDLPAGPAYVAPREWPAVEVEVRLGQPTVLATADLTIQIEEQPLGLTFGDARGTPLLWAPIDEGVVIDTIPRRDDSRLAGEPGDAADRRRITAHFTWSGEQHFYGLGEGGRQFDRLGGARQLWNSHFGHGPGSDIGVPLLLSTAGYGLLFANPSDARLIVGRTEDHDRLVYEAEDGSLDWYVLQGSDLRGVLTEVASLLGRAPLPPRWSLGFLQSTRHFADTAEVRGLATRLRERRIPCDGLVFLSTYGDAMGWNRGVGHLEFQPQLMPQPAELLAEMRAAGYQVITHEYPVLHEDSPLFAEALERGYLLAAGYERLNPPDRPTTNFHEGQRFIDFSHPDARTWWWERHRSLADLGVGGWWLDGGEGPPASAALHEGNGLTLHNLFDRRRQQAFAEGESRDYPDRRPFLLCRSGAAGMQQYGAGCWSGDINNTFATLEAQVPLGLNTGMSGIPYWGTDIGGFFHPIPESGELYARWFQFGAFCPGFRAHGFVWRDHLPWAHGEEIEAICRRYAELRYRLLPYTYTLAWQAHTHGLPLMRPLVLNYPDDPAVWELGSQYLWGDDLLVAPVTRQGATAWPVYLPAGAWYDYWTHRRYDGPVGVTVEAPLDRLPLFVRGGAILPLAPVAQFDGERSWDEITLRIYPAESSRFDLYEDDGRTNAYRQDRSAITAISCASEGGRVTVRIDPPSGDADVIPPGRVYSLQIWGDDPNRVWVDGRRLARRDDAAEPEPSEWYHEGHFIHVRLRRSAATVSIEP